MKALFNRFVREESGQDLIEYLLFGTLIVYPRPISGRAAGGLGSLPSTACGRN